MTPDAAAATLGLRADASVTDIDHAYRRLARDLHPDRFGDRPSAEMQAASERFIEVTVARDVMLAVAARRLPANRVGGGSFPAGDSRFADAAASADLRPFSWPLFTTWTMLLLLGAFFSFSSGPVFAPIDLWLRLALLVVFALATALTGRRWVWLTTLVLVAVSAVATVIATSVGGLLGLGVMIIAVLGLAVQGRLVRFP